MLDRNQITGTLPRKWNALVTLQQLYGPPAAPLLLSTGCVTGSLLLINLHIACLLLPSTVKPAVHSSCLQ
jgi:hypothetical protein